MEDDFSTLAARIKKDGAWKHEDELARFLATKNLDQIVAFATRQSLIVFPLLGLSLQYKSLLSLTGVCFRANITSGQVIFDRSPEVMKAAAATAAARAATAATARATRATRAATTATDIQRLFDGFSAKQLIESPLFEDEILYADLWEGLKAHLIQDNALWGNLISWQEDRVKGEPMPLPLQRELVLISDDIWEGDHHALLSEIHRLVLKHKPLPEIARDLDLYETNDDGVITRKLNHIALSAKNAFSDFEDLVEEIDNLTEVFRYQEPELARIAEKIKDNLALGFERYDFNKLITSYRKLGSILTLVDNAQAKIALQSAYTSLQVFLSHYPEANESNRRVANFIAAEHPHKDLINSITELTELIKANPAVHKAVSDEINEGVVDATAAPEKHKTGVLVAVTEKIYALAREVAKQIKEKLIDNAAEFISKPLKELAGQIVDALYNKYWTKAIEGLSYILEQLSSFLPLI